MNRLTRHEKQAVRRFIRTLARRHGRNHRGDCGSILGTDFLICIANHRMGQSGTGATVYYPQDVGCGTISVSQIIALWRDGKRKTLERDAS